MVANLLGHAEVGRTIARQPVGIHHVGIVASHHESRQVAVEDTVVVARPFEGLGKGNHLAGVLPGGVILGIDGYVLVPDRCVVGRSEVVGAVFENNAARAVLQFAHVSAVLLQGGFQPQAHNHAKAWQVGRQRGVQVGATRHAAVGHRGRRTHPGPPEGREGRAGAVAASVPADILIWTVAAHRAGGAHRDVGEEHFVDSAVLIEAPVDAQLGAQGLYLCEVNDPLHAFSLHMRRRIHVLIVHGVGASFVAFERHTPLPCTTVCGRWLRTSPSPSKGGEYGHHACLAVDAEHSVLGADATRLEGRRRSVVVGKRRVVADGHIRPIGLVPVGGNAHAGALHGERHAKVGLMGVLPAQVAIVESLRGVRIVGVVGTVVLGGGTGKGEQVGVRRPRIEHLKRGQLHTLPPPCMHTEVGDPCTAAVAPEDVAAIDAGRQTAHGAVVGAADQGDVVAQPCRQFCERPSPGVHRDARFAIQGHVVHPRQLVVAVLAPRRCIAHVFVIDAAPCVVAARHLCTCHQSSVHVWVGCWVMGDR